MKSDHREEIKIDDFVVLKSQCLGGGYAKSIATIDRILNATLRVLTIQGGSAFTMRQVALESGISLGNLQYHFPTKTLLVRAFLKSVLDYYVNLSRKRSKELAQMSNVEKLKGGLIDALKDAQTLQTTYLFTELWSLGNRDKEIEEALSEFYRVTRSHARYYVSKLNPSLSDDDADRVAMFLSSFIEGSVVFAGYGKTDYHAMPDLAAIAFHAFLKIVDSITSEEIRSFRADWPKG
jgi:AcrR family transcriptional regulator